MRFELYPFIHALLNIKYELTLYKILLQSICFRMVTNGNGTTKVSTGCRKIDTCPFGALPSSQSSANCEDNNDTETCLTCDYKYAEGFSRCNMDNPCVDKENNTMDLYCYTCTNKDGESECSNGNFKKCEPKVTTHCFVHFP